MLVNRNIVPRLLTREEWDARRRGEYDSFANYLVLCPNCGHMEKTNVYIMRAEEYVRLLKDASYACSDCGGRDWDVGYPANSTTGFVPFP